MNNNVLYRKIKITDAKDIIDYCNIVGGQTDNLTFGENQFPYNVETEKEFIKYILLSETSEYIIATHAGKIVGTASVLSNPKGRFVHNVTIGVSVLKEYWNLGIGSSLLERIIHISKKNSHIKNMILEVRSDNEKAINLYKKYGFKKVGTLYENMCINNTYYDIDIMMLKLR